MTSICILEKTADSGIQYSTNIPNMYIVQTNTHIYMQINIYIYKYN